MPDMRLTVRRRGTVVEGEFLPSLVLIHTLFEYFVLFPEFYDLFFALHEIERSRYLFIHNSLF